jgi:SsrA-binding protein
MAKKKDERKENQKAITTHREARHHYEILDSIEVGIVLVGCEVKSLRDSQCNLAGSFARFEGKELFLYNSYIAPYESGSRENPDPKRNRKLLMHKSQLEKFRVRTQEKGLVLIPLKMYFNDRGMAKLELGLGKSKKHEDQRSDIKDREARRQMDRAVKNRNTR